MHAGKFIDVSSDQGELVLKGVPRDEGVERADGLADLCQILADLRGMPGGGLREWKKG